VKSKTEANAITAGIKRVPRHGQQTEDVQKAVREIWGDKLDDPDTRALVRKTVVVTGSAWSDEGELQPGPSRQPANSDSDSDSSSTSESVEEQEGTLRQRKADLGLFKHVPEGHIVLKEFQAAFKKESTSADATKKTTERLSLFLGYAEDQNPTQIGYWALVNEEAAKKYVAANKQVRVKSATMVIYAKAVMKCLTLMKKRPKKMPSVPWGEPGFQQKFDQAIVEWSDVQKKYGRKAVRDRNGLAKGEAVIASTPACYTYITSETERNRVKRDLERVKSFARSKTQLAFGRGDVADVNAYNSLVCFLMIMLCIRNGGPRTGVLQNFRLSELEAAEEKDEWVVVRIARHQTGQQGNASLVMSREEFPWLREYAEIRRRIRCTDKEDKQRVFVTTGGLVFRTHNQDINRWMKKKWYPGGRANAVALDPPSPSWKTGRERRIRIRRRRA